MFQGIKQSPPDPILGLSAAYKNDTNPNKVDLGVGIYKDEAGNCPVMTAVRKAENTLWKTEDSKSYIAQAGPELFIKHTAELVLGAGHKALADKRVATVLAPAGPARCVLRRNSLHITFRAPAFSSAIRRGTTTPRCSVRRV